MNEVRLKWIGPFTLEKAAHNSVFASEAASDPGLYVWVVQSGAHTLAYYVGETGATFARRHRSHLHSYRTGSYSIDRADALSRGRIEPLYQGFVYSKKARLLREPEFTARRAELDAELARCFAILRVYLAPLRSDQRSRRRIETGLVDTIIKVGAGLDGFEKVKWSRWPRLPGEPPIAVSCTGLSLRNFPVRYDA
jgi:hypothetical protein